MIFINSWLSNCFHCPHTEISVFSGCFAHGVTQWVLHSTHSLAVLPSQLSLWQYRAPSPSKELQCPLRGKRHFWL